MLEISYTLFLIYTFQINKTNFNETWQFINIQEKILKNIYN